MTNPKSKPAHFLYLKYFKEMESRHNHRSKNIADLIKKVVKKSRAILTSVTLFYLVFFGVMFILSLFIILFLSYILHIDNVAPQHAVAYIIFLCLLTLSQILFSYYYRKLYLGWRLIATGLLFFILTYEFLLISFTPRDSLAPEDFLLRLGAIERVETNRKCDVMKNFSLAKDFFRNSSLDMDNIKIFYSWAPQNLAKLYLDKGLKFNGIVAGNTIYLNKKRCIDEAILVHELVHIWQFQNRPPRGISDFIGNIITTAKQIIGNFREPYDYGNIEGLKIAKNSGRTFSDFNIEQQAQIIEHYFLAREYRVFYSEDPYALEYLEYFASEVVSSR